MDEIKERQQKELKSWNELLLNREIVNIRWATEQEQESLGFYDQAIVITLDNGNHIVPSRDPEGNDAGSLFVFHTENGQPKHTIIYPR